MPAVRLPAPAASLGSDTGRGRVRLGELIRSDEERKRSRSPTEGLDVRAVRARGSEEGEAAAEPQEEPLPAEAEDAGPQPGAGAGDAPHRVGDQPPLLEEKGEWHPRFGFLMPKYYDVLEQLPREAWPVNPTQAKHSYRLRIYGTCFIIVDLQRGLFRATLGGQYHSVNFRNFDGGVRAAWEHAVQQAFEWSVKDEKMRGYIQSERRFHGQWNKPQPKAKAAAAAVPAAAAAAGLVGADSDTESWKVVGSDDESGSQGCDSD